MEQKQHSEICIIGAGIGGLATGMLLTKKGYHVTIFEKESMIGGRALSLTPALLNVDTYKQILQRFHMDIPFAEPDLPTLFAKQMFNGYTFDLGYHAIGGGAVSSITRLLSEIGEHVDMFESNVGFIKNNGYDFPFLSRKDKLIILPRILRLILASEKTMQRLDHVSITQTINRYGTGKMKLILEVFSRSISTINNLNDISTGEMFRSQKILLKGSKPVGYPKKGLGEINQKLANYIIKNGGKIHLNTPVEKILIENGQCTGIVVGKKTILFPVVISNILIQDLFQLADQKNFPKEYIKNIQILQGTGSVCAYYSLKNIDKKLLGKTFHFLERNIGVDGNDAVGMIDFMTAVPDSGLAPPSHHLIQAYIVCTPQEACDPKTQKTLRKILDKNLHRLIPNYQMHLNWAIYPVVWHLDGVAKTIDNKKPEIQTPLENLYLVGDCVKAPGIGINCAIQAARMLADHFPLLK